MPRTPCIQTTPFILLLEARRAFDARRGSRTRRAFKTTPFTHVLKARRSYYARRGSQARRAFNPRRDRIHC